MNCQAHITTAASSQGGVRELRRTTRGLSLILEGEHMCLLCPSSQGQLDHARSKQDKAEHGGRKE